MTVNSTKPVTGLPQEITEQPAQKTTTTKPQNVVFEQKVSGAQDSITVTKQKIELEDNKYRNGATILRDEYNGIVKNPRYSWSNTNNYDTVNSLIKKAKSEKLFDRLPAEKIEKLNVIIADLKGTLDESVDTRWYSGGAAGDVMEAIKSKADTNGLDILELSYVVTRMDDIAQKKRGMNNKITSFLGNSNRLLYSGDAKTESQNALFEAFANAAEKSTANEALARKMDAQKEKPQIAYDKNYLGTERKLAETIAETYNETDAFRNSKINAAVLDTLKKAKQETNLPGERLTALDAIVEDLELTLDDTIDTHTFSGGRAGVVMEKIAESSGKNMLDVTELAYVINRIDEISEKKAEMQSNWLNRNNAKITDYLGNSNRLVKSGDAYSNSQLALHKAFKDASIRGKINIDAREAGQKEFQALAQGDEGVEKLNRERLKKQNELVEIFNSTKKTKDDEHYWFRNSYINDITDETLKQFEENKGAEGINSQRMTKLNVFVEELRETFDKAATKHTYSGGRNGVVMERFAKIAQEEKFSLSDAFYVLSKINQYTEERGAKLTTYLGNSNRLAFSGDASSESQSSLFGALELSTKNTDNDKIMIAKKIEAKPAIIVAQTDVAAPAMPLAVVKPIGTTTLPQATPSALDDVKPPTKPAVTIPAPSTPAPREFTPPPRPNKTIAQILQNLPTEIPPISTLPEQTIDENEEEKVNNAIPQFNAPPKEKNKKTGNESVVKTLYYRKPPTLTERFA